MWKTRWREGEENMEIVEGISEEEKAQKKKSAYETVSNSEESIRNNNGIPNESCNFNYMEEKILLLIEKSSVYYLQQNKVILN